MSIMSLLLLVIAQSGPHPGFDPAPALDPVKAAPHIYAAKLENEHVRAILTTARPGELTPLHSHPGRVAVFLNACVDRRVNDKGETSERKFAAGDILWAPAETHGDFKYAFVEECRIVEVEVKAAL